MRVATHGRSSLITLLKSITVLKRISSDHGAVTDVPRRLVTGDTCDFSILMNWTVASLRFEYMH